MMDIITKNKGNISNPEIETVQKQKHEYYLLGAYARKKGLRLFAYSFKNGNITELNIKYSNTATVISDDNGGLTWMDEEFQKCNVDSRDIHFECLNLKSAIKRFTKWKSGTIKELCNLREPTKGMIDIFIGL